MPMVRAEVQFRDEQRAALEAVARRRGMSVSAHVREAVDRYLQREEQSRAARRSARKGQSG